MQRTFTVTEGVPLNQALPTQAASVIIDNLTGSWMQIPGAERPVPPYTWGVVLPLGAATSVAVASWSTPPGISPALAGTGSATTTWTSDRLAASNGASVVVPTSQTVPLTVAVAPGGNLADGTPAALVGAQRLPLTTGAPGTSGSYTMTLPAATESLMLVMTSGVGQVGAVKVIIEGAQSGQFYTDVLGTLLTAQAAPSFLPIVTGADRQVLVSLTTTVTPTPNTFVELIAMPFPGAVTVVQNPGTSFNETLLTLGDAGYNLHIGGMPGSNQLPVPVSPAGDSGLGLALFAANIASGGTVTIIPADFSLRACYAYGLRFTAEGAVGNLPVFELRAAGVAIDQYFMTGPGQVVETQYFGVALTKSGGAIVLANVDSVAHTVRGHLVYRLI